MATRSTVPTVRAALVTALAARPALTGVQVAHSHPGAAVEVESVYLGRARGSDNVPVMRAGRKRRQESYTVDVFFDVVGDGPTGQDASERAWTLFGELEDLLADDPSLGQAPPFWAVLGEWDETLFFDDTRQGFGSLLRAAVQIEARLT
jgi:hypothetical protein